MKVVSSSSKESVSKPDNEDVSEWLSGQLKFVRDPSAKVYHSLSLSLSLSRFLSLSTLSHMLLHQNFLQDDMTRKDDPNSYVVYDPLLEKGKEKFNKMQTKLKRREREWAGKSLT